MKNILIFLTLLAYANANELAWVDEQIEAIKPPRIGIDSKQFSYLKDPFIFLKKNQTPKEETKTTQRTASSSIPAGVLTSRAPSKSKNNKNLNLIAVINNKALINGQWYTVGAEIRRYKLTQVNSSSVLLTKGKKTLMLSTRTQNSNLKFKEK